jgi:hypothetical protein
MLRRSMRSFSSPRKGGAFRISSIGYGPRASSFHADYVVGDARSNSKARKDSGGKREEPKGEGKGVEEGRSRKDAAAKKHGVTKSRDRDEYQVHGEDSRNMDEVAGIQKSVRELRYSFLSSALILAREVI